MKLKIQRIYNNNYTFFSFI